MPWSTRFSRPQVAASSMTSSSATTSIGLCKGRVAISRSEPWCRRQGDTWNAARGIATCWSRWHWLEEARPAEIAPLMLSAHRLTAREGEITQLVAQGLSTMEIADRLTITVNTVQDYLKAIFDK